MITFDDLRISEDKAMLTVQCHVSDYDIYDNMYIKEIYLEYYKNRGVIGVPSNKALKIFDNGTGDTSVRSASVNVSASSLSGMDLSSFDKGLFYVYVKCDGTLAPEVAGMSCGYDVTTSIGIVIDWYLFYGFGMNYVSRMARGGFCDVPADFEHFILLWNALRLAVETSDWVNIEMLWERLIQTNVIAVASKCGCGS